MTILHGEGFDALEESTQDVVVAIPNSRSAFESVTKTQTVALAQLHALTNSIIGEEHQKTHAEITDAMLRIINRGSDRHGKPREELARMAAEASSAKKIWSTIFSRLKHLSLPQVRLRDQHSRNS